MIVLKVKQGITKMSNNFSEEQQREMFERFHKEKMEAERRHNLKVFASIISFVAIASFVISFLVTNEFHRMFASLTGWLFGIPALLLITAYVVGYKLLNREKRKRKRENV